MYFQTSMLGARGADFAPAHDYVSPSIDKPAPEDIQSAKIKKAIGILAAATGEEFLYRWFLFHLLLGFFSSEAGVVIVSSLLFGLMHYMARAHEPTLMNQLVLVLPAMIAGLGFSIQYLRIGIGTSILLHLAVNLMSAFKEEPFSSNIAYSFMLFVLVFLPILLASIGMKKFRRLP